MDSSPEHLCGGKNRFGRFISGKAELFGLQKHPRNLSRTIPIHLNPRITWAGSICDGSRGRSDQTDPQSCPLTRNTENPAYLMGKIGKVPA